MPQIMILLIGILFLGCQTELSTTPKPKSSTKSQLMTKNMQSIEGNYTLEKGVYSYNGKNSINNEIITYSNLVIENLDDDDYGYYLIMQVDNLAPIEDIGIFHKEGNQYYKRIIYSKNITKESNISIDSNISDENLQTEITDKIKLSYDNNSIKIDMKVGTGRAIIEWRRDLDSSLFTSKELKHAKQEYIETYKERFLKYFKDI